MNASSPRSWRRPQLIVLVRGAPEEAVLAGCKGDGVPTSFLNHYAGCHSDQAPCVTLCQDQFAS